MLIEGIPVIDLTGMEYSFQKDNHLHIYNKLTNIPISKIYIRDRNVFNLMNVKNILFTGNTVILNYEYISETFIRSRGFTKVIDKHRKHPDKEIIMPVRKTKYSACYDFCTVEDITLLPHEHYNYYSDIKVYMLPDERFNIYPRSSLAAKGILLTTTVGKIDSDYFDNVNNDGNIIIPLWNVSDVMQTIEKGTRVAQGEFGKYLIIDDDDADGIRVGGFGSSGEK